MLQLHHSAAVHIPLALAFLFPLSHLSFLVLSHWNYLPAKLWRLQWAVAGIQLVTCVVSYLTGQRDYALSAADTQLLLKHRELALQFTWIWLGIFLALPLTFWFQKNIRFYVGQTVLLVALAAQFYVAIRLGQIGGEIVFGQ